MDKFIEKFITHVKTQTKINKVELSLENKPYIDDGDGRLCNGYFNDKDQPILAVAVGKSQEEWLPILVHEFSHMKQWEESHPYWTGLNLHLGEASDLLDEWLDGKDFKDKDIDKIIKAIINVEYDCECRTIKLIEEFNLPIKKEVYIQKSLSYVLFYHVVKHERKWYEPKKEPYMIKDVYKSMPTTMDINIHEPPQELLEVIKKNCF